jgi:sialate O-acetylesterase
MVLQAESKVPIWGTANPGESVTVRTAGYSVTAQAGAAGLWVIRLPAMHASESPSILIVAGATNAVSISNVLVGDVWLCSGQSNMQKPIGPWPGQQPVLNYEQEIAEANYPSIRLFCVEESQAFVPQSTCRGKWEVCRPQTAGKFSAAAYFFARQLVRDHHGPVGLITATAGGTLAQAWTSIPALKNVPTFRGIAERGEELAAFAHQDKPLR